MVTIYRPIAMKTNERQEIYAKDRRRVAIYGIRPLIVHCNGFRFCLMGGGGGEENFNGASGRYIY